MSLFVTPLYAALLAFVFIALSFRVIFVRRSERVSLGDGDNPALRARIRVHANFAENVPLALLLILMVELMDGGAFLLHALGAMLLVGRIAHAYGTSAHPQIFLLRQVGMVLTFTSILIAAAANLWLALF